MVTWFVLFWLILIVVIATSTARRRKLLDGRFYDVKVCRQCGTSQPTHAGYCRECGGRLDG